MTRVPLGHAMTLTVEERALIMARRSYPHKSAEEVQEIADEWVLDACDDEPPEDSPCLENGRDNCDDWGTGEGRYHGRV
jgi:hypothetical protein